MRFRDLAENLRVTLLSGWRRYGVRLMLAAVMLGLAGHFARAGSANAPDGNKEQAGVRTRLKAQTSENGCGSDRPGENLICPTPDDDSFPFIERISSDAASNGIAVLFTAEGMSMASSCQGSRSLATMVAELYARIPASARAEGSIEWAIPRMTGEIRGHAMAYRAAVTDSIRARANPVNIVFPEYRGEFPGGVIGVSSRAQQLLWASLC